MIDFVAIMKTSKAKFPDQYVTDCKCDLHSYNNKIIYRNTFFFFSESQSEPLVQKGIFTFKDIVLFMNALKYTGIVEVVVCHIMIVHKRGK